MHSTLAVRRDAVATDVARNSMVELIEAFFFAYRDFVGDADRLLESYRFGRAHHRALHFVNRRPGLTIAELLEILQITKQSLNRVLRELIAGDFIEARSGPQDRRQRLLFASEKGNRLAAALIGVQSARLEGAIKAMGAGGEAAARAFLDGVSRAPVGP